MRRRLRLWVATGGNRYRAREEAVKGEEEALEGRREEEVVGPRAVEGTEEVERVVVLMAVESAEAEVAETGEGETAARVEAILAEAVRVEVAAEAVV